MDLPMLQAERDRLAETVEKTALARSDLVFAISRFLERRATKLGARHVEYLPPLVDTSMFKPLGPTEQDQRSGVFRGDPTVIFSGYWWELKGLGLLMDAAEILIREWPRMTFLLVGGTDKDFEFFERCSRGRASRVRFRLLGALPFDAMPAMYALADVAVIPFPNNHVNLAAGPTKLVEYMACGKAIVGTTTGDIPEILDSGRYGVIVDATGEALARGISRLLSEPELREWLGTNARQRAVEWHDAYRRAPQIAESIRGLAIG
jgi:glycosyltransferase involved in cell wall biosynthesis